MQKKFYPNAHLNSKFWALPEPTFTIKSFDRVSLSLHFEDVLVPTFVWKDGIEYEFRVIITWLEAKQAIELFRVLSEAASRFGSPTESWENIPCLEFKGELSWSNYDGRNGRSTRAKYFKYELLVKSVRSVGHIPLGIEAERISLEDALARCTSKD